MSGGSYDYLYSRVDDMADELLHQRDIKRRAFGKHLKLVAKAMHDIEWVDSGDYCVGDDIEAIDKLINHGQVVDVLKDDLDEIVRQVNALKESL